MEDVVNSLEPYASYRFVLGLVLIGLFVYFTWTAVMSLRNMQGLLDDLNAQVNENRMFDDVRVKIDPDVDLSAERPLRARPGRIVKLSVLSSCLRLFSLRTIVYVLPELIAVTLLGTASAVAYWFVFTMNL